MRGIIFTALADMVEEQYGLLVWDELLSSCQFSHGGAYTAGGMYPDAELAELVDKVQRKLDVPSAFILREFGLYLFDVLSASHSHYFTQSKDFSSFLMSINDTIHRDMERVHPGAYFPFLKVENTADGKGLTVTYSSPRKLCFLAEGLMNGVANWYGVEIGMVQQCCMHRGDSQCRFEINIHG